MARALEAEQITPADELRALITESEKQVANVRGQGPAALSLLRKLDRIGELWPALESAGVDLRPEAGRWETLQAQVRSHAALIGRELQAAGGLPALRGQGAAAELPWWWYLDRLEQERRRSRLIRSAVTVLAVVVVVAAAAWLFRRLFPVDPRVAGASQHISAGQQMVTERGDYAGALAEFQAAANLTPDDASAWLWVGAAQQKLGQDPAQAFAAARRLSGDELTYLVARGQVYTELGEPDRARDDLNAALRIDPQNPQAWYFLATAEEAQGNLAAAAGDLDKASSYADARNQSELVAMARVRLGFLLQRMQANQASGASPTPPTP